MTPQPLPFDSISSTDMDLLRAHACRGSLKQFIYTFWHIVEPSTTLLWNWHLDVIVDVLESVTRGELKRVIFNVPPGTGKSLIINVFHIAWEWASDPSLRHFLASYSDKNPIRDNRKLRDIVASKLYQQLFWDEFKLETGEVVKVEIASDQRAKVRLDTSLKGYSIASSVGGGGTGEHPDRIRIDDPHKANEADSLVSRDDVGGWFKGTISTRKARNPATMITMQRLNEDDLSGRELPKGIYEHVMFPMRYEIPTIEVDEDTKRPGGHWDCPCHADGPDHRDPRTREGELLFPALYGETAVEIMELDLDVFEASGQLQQRPVPISGGLFKRIWFATIEVLPAGRIMWGRGWDTAATADAGAYSVGTKMGRILSGLQRGKFVIDLDSEVREQVEDVDPWILSTAKLDGRSVRIREEQTPALGKTIIASHIKMLVGYDYAGVPSSKDKISKSKPWRVQCKAGNVLLLVAQDKRRANDWLDEVCGFPLHKYKDRVDSASIIFNSLALEDKKKLPRAIGGRRLRKAVSRMRR